MPCYSRVVFTKQIYPIKIILDILLYRLKPKMQFSNSEPVFTLTSRKTLDCTKVTTGFQTNIQNEFKRYVRTQGFQRNIHSNVNKYVPRGLKEIFKYILTNMHHRVNFFLYLFGGEQGMVSLELPSVFLDLKRCFCHFYLYHLFVKGARVKRPLSIFCKQCFHQA